MSDDRTDLEDRSVLAGEYALGVLTGDEHRRARELYAADPEFRAGVERWTGRFAGFLDEVPDLDPPQNVWTRIAAAVGSNTSNDNVIRLHRKVRLWRGAALGLSALAACLALFIAFRPPETIMVQPRAVAPMVALLGDDSEVKVVASWDANARQLVLAVPEKLAGDAAHSHELWVIPSGGKPVSIGILSAADQSHVRLAEALAELMREGATIAISVEPRGGSPTGAPTGPVVASGSLKPA